MEEATASCCSSQNSTRQSSKDVSYDYLNDFYGKIDVDGKNL